MKSLVTVNGRRYPLSPLSYEEFLYLGLWIGGAEDAWVQWLEFHRFSSLSDFNAQTLAGATISINETPYPVLKFSVDRGETWLVQEAHEPQTRGIQYLTHLTRS